MYMFMYIVVHVFSAKIHVAVAGPQMSVSLYTCTCPCTNIPWFTCKSKSIHNSYTCTCTCSSCYCTFFLGKAKSAKRYFGCKNGVTSKLSLGNVANGGEIILESLWSRESWWWVLNEKEGVRGGEEKASGCSGERSSTLLDTLDRWLEIYVIMLF